MVRAVVEVPIATHVAQDRESSLGGFSVGPDIRVPSYDSSQQRQLKDMALAYAQTARNAWGLIGSVLGETSSPPQITIQISYRYLIGAAGARGDLIRVNAEYALMHRDDLGLIVHELTHVAQGYRGEPPDWLTEGIADYVRYFGFEPEERRPVVFARDANPKGSYKTTACFLDWVGHTYKPDIVQKLNGLLRQGAYADDAWVGLTGRSLDQLGEEWKKSLL
jgi:hypothetical protein